MTEYDEAYWQKRPFEEHYLFEDNYLNVCFNNSYMAKKGNVPWNVGMKPWDWLGKEKWDEMNKKHSSFMKEWHKKNKHPMLGKKQPPQVGEAVRKANLGRKFTKEHREKLRKVLNKAAIFNLSPLEKKLKAYFNKNDLFPVPQFIFNDMYRLDFAFPEKKLNIECDGNNHYEFKVKKQDELRDAILIKEGWTVLRFKNKRVKNDIEGVLSEIKKHL